ncbi:MAG: hypothetical protein ACTSYH_03670 [Candidatus Heimdallarchaeaceae archaeon]
MSECNVCGNTIILEEVEFNGETDKAIFIKHNGENICLPKSQIEYDENPTEGDLIDVELPTWLADEKDIDYES